MEVYSLWSDFLPSILYFCKIKAIYGPCWLQKLFLVALKWSVCED